MCRQPPEAVRAQWLVRHGYTEVPIQVSKTSVLDITATANGKPLRLLIDTGAVRDYIDSSVQKRLELRPEPIEKEDVESFAGRSEIQERLTVDDFAVGLLHGRWQALLLDQSGLAPRDGMLGNGYLLRNAAVIDYGSKRMFLCNRSEHSPRDNNVTDRGSDEFAALLKKQAYQEVPLSYGEKIARPHVDATINGEPLRLKVDTGATSSILATSLIERCRLPKYDAAQRIRTAFGVLHTAYRTHAKNFSFGGRTEELDALLLDMDRQNAELKSIGEHPADGILGSRFLLAHAAVIDFGAKKLYVQARQVGQK